MTLAEEKEALKRKIKQDMKKKKPQKYKKQTKDILNDPGGKFAFSKFKAPTNTSQDDIKGRAER